MPVLSLSTTKSKTPLYSSASISVHKTSRLSLVTLSTSSNTAVGIARPPPLVPAPPSPPLVPFAPLTTAFLPFTPLTPSAGLLFCVSFRTSSSTRRINVGKVVASPDRRSVRACDWIREGQLVEWAFNACRSESCILWRSEERASQHGCSKKGKERRALVIRTC
jgi:hypothetical protein